MWVISWIRRSLYLQENISWYSLIPVLRSNRGVVEVSEKKKSLSSVENRSTIPLLSWPSVLARPLTAKAQDINSFQYYRIFLLAYIHTFHKCADLVVCKSSVSATCNYVQFRHVQRDTNYKPGNGFRVFYVQFRIASLFTVPIFWVNSRMVKLALRAETQEHANIMWAIHRQPGASTSEKKSRPALKANPSIFSWQ